MSDASTADAPTQRFAEAVRNFAGVPPKRFAALLPHRDGIAELRQKGASFGMIRELLAMAGIEVAADTVRRFYREVIEEPRIGAKRRRSVNDQRRPRRSTRPPQRHRRRHRLPLPHHPPPPRHRGPAAPASLIRATSKHRPLTL